MHSEEAINKTKWEIYPIDRHLNAEAVYTFFKETYRIHDNKSIYFTERKYQRLREGYFGLFVLLALREIHKVEYWIIFPSNPSLDLYITRIEGAGPENPTSIALKFDIKEFTKHSDTFSGFIERSIEPKLGKYTIIIGLLRTIEQSDIEKLVALLFSYNSSETIKIHTKHKFAK